MGERIQQTITDTKDYHYDVWYGYRDEVIVSNEEVKAIRIHR